MKTGFIYGYPNKPGKKRYSYHGLERDCLIQPSPDPFEEFPVVSPLGEWELLWHTALSAGGWSYLRKDINPLIPSSDDDPCPVTYTDGKKRYIFCEIEMFRAWSGGRMYLRRSDGLVCTYPRIGGNYNYIYKAWFTYVWAGWKYYCGVQNVKVPSYLNVWRSKDGEFPGYFPVPENEIMY